MFRMIGHYEIRRDGDVICVQSSSEFNLEAAQQYARDIMEMIAQMPPRFATLVEFEEPPVIGPDVEDAMRRSVEQRAQRGMRAVAFVMHSRAGLDIAHTQWRRVYEGTGVDFDVFDDFSRAREWLQAKVDATR